MEELQDIIANYPLIRPAVSFLSGAIIGTTTRLFQNYVFKSKEDKKASWFPACSALTGLLIASQAEDPDLLDYKLNLWPALIGDYVGISLVEKLKSKE